MQSIEIIARPHVVFECIVTQRGKRRNMARVSAYWHIPAYLQTNSTNCTIKYLIHFGLINTPNGALRASRPPPITIAASYSSSKTIQKTISRNKVLPFWPELWPPEAYIFLLDHRAPLAPPIAPFYATQGQWICWCATKGALFSYTHTHHIIKVSLHKPVAP